MEIAEIFIGGGGICPMAQLQLKLRASERVIMRRRRAQVDTGLRWSGQVAGKDEGHAVAGEGGITGQCDLELL